MCGEKGLKLGYGRLSDLPDGIEFHGVVIKTDGERPYVIDIDRQRTEQTFLKRIENIKERSRKMKAQGLKLKYEIACYTYGDKEALKSFMKALNDQAEQARRKKPILHAA